MAEEKEVLLEVKNLKKYFTVQKSMLGKPTSVLKAVDDVSFKIYKGECLGLVGESGCGKSTIGKMLVNLYQPTDGQIFFEGEDITKLDKKKRRSFCKDIQLIFQDPYASLNPRMTVGDIIAEPIIINNLLPKDKVEERVNYLMNCVGLANHQRNRYPHEFSGGQRQRIGIARALAVNPKLIVCDEPVSALDVSIQAQVLNLLDDLKEEFGLTYLFIAHGLNVVKHISDRVGVMYLGKLMELAEKNELYNHPKNPYTQALLSAIPTTDINAKKERIILTGDVPTPIDPKPGCRFYPRCFTKCDACQSFDTQLIDTGEGHLVSCQKYI
jgi:peptide/nickel transport system ATP-binding protein